jgi:hypothetical protein
MTLERLAQEPLGGRRIAPLAESEPDRAAIAAEGAVEIRPMSPHLDICLASRAEESHPHALSEPYVVIRLGIGTRDSGGTAF